MLTPDPHDVPRHPLHRKPRFRMVLVGLLVVGAAALLPPDHVSASAQALAAASAATMVLRGTKGNGKMLG
ncbi:hypothetical protein ABZ400_02825 [Streptomyces sp. NPDC005897]|uniref:hypothetical protein n=1 Tax=Streptomyces sp. NPDC005897 TaxID=3157081 RepID=UPI0033C5E271